MAYVEKLREELMESLGIGVERSPPFTSIGACRKGDGQRGCEYGRVGEGVLAEPGGKVRQRSSNNSNNNNNNNSSTINRGAAMMTMNSPWEQQQQQQHPSTTEQNPVGYIDSSSSRTRSGGGGIVHRKRARPASATARAPSTNNSRERPASASSARRPVNIVNETRTSSINGRKSNKDMDVLLEICRDQGQGFSLDPADFDSSISAICNLPIGPFAGASREGWGNYFRELHGHMRTRKNTTTTTTSHHGGPTKRAAVRSSPARARRRPPERRGKWGRQQRPPPAKQSTRNSNRSSACRTANTYDKQQKNDPDDAAAARARTTRRAAEESVVWRMAVRLQTLWQELKIPEPDQEYITATYLGGGGTPGAVNAIGTGPGRDTEGIPTTSHEAYVELVRQMRLLLDYRTSTIKVLRSVSLRESRLTEVEQALQAFQWHRGRDTDAVGLVAALAGLRGASLGVVRAVVEWRQKLWQPRAFSWRGVNYLKKMSRDTLFLRSPVGRSLLASVGLGVTDMTFVLFPSADEYDQDDDDGNSPGAGHEGRGEEPAGVRAPPPIVRLTPKAELALEYRARFFEQPVEAAAETGGEARGGEGGKGGFLGQSADGEKRHEVEAVVQEAALQRRVEAEQARLAAKGCFVPLLRWLPIGQKVPHAKTRRQSPPAIPPPAEPVLKTNIDSGNDGGTNQSAGVARGRGLAPAASSTLPTPTNTFSTPKATAESYRQRVVGRSASAAQELEELAESGGNEAVVGKSMSPSQGSMLSALNSIAERDNERETTFAARVVGRVVKHQDGGEGDEAEGRGGGGGLRAGKGYAPRPDKPDQTRLCQEDDGKRLEPENSTPSYGGDVKRGEGRANDESRPTDKIGAQELNGNDKIGDGGDDGGGRESDRGGGRGGYSGEGDEQREGSVAPSAASYDNDFEDDAQDSPLSRSEGGTTTGSCHGSSNGPVGGVRGVPMAEEPAETTHTAGGGSTLTEGARVAAGETEQERRRRLNQHGDIAATRIQRMVRTAHQQGIRGRRVEAGEEEAGATDRKAWLAAWRARRETQVSRAQTDAAIRIQSTARAKRASDEVSTRRRQHATRILDATVSIQAFARRWKAYRREAVQEPACEPKGSPTRTEAGTSPEQQKILVDEKAEETNDRSFSTPNQAALLSQTKERRQEPPKRATTISEAASSAGSGQKVSKRRESARERELPEKTLGGSSAVSSSQGPTSKNSYSSITSPGGHRSPSSGSEGSSLSGLLGSLNSSDRDDIIMSSSTDSNALPTGGVKHHQSGKGDNWRTDGDRGEERRDVGPADSANVPPRSLSSSSSGLVEVAAAADDPTQLQRKEGASASGKGGEDPCATVQTSDDALHATGGPVLLSLSLSMDGSEDPASEEARLDSAGGGPPPSSFPSDPPMMPGDVNSSPLVALSPVPEERAMLATTTASVSEYGGSDDLNFEALSSSRDSESVGGVGKEVAKGIAPTIGGADAPMTQASGAAGALEGVPDARRDEAVEEAGDDSDGSLMSLSSSSSDS